MTEYIFLTQQHSISERNEIELADLIYETDPFIYPAMFINKNNARKILPKLLYTDDSMFKISNYLLAKKDEKIVGLLLWIKGDLVWDPANLIKISIEEKIPISPYLNNVSGEYISNYDKNVSQDAISIINLCVSSPFRHCGIGRGLLNKLIAEYPETTFELCVLERNHNARELYRKVGFVEIEEYTGFSIEKKKPLAIKMIRQ